MKPRIAIWAAVSTPEQATVDKDSLPSQIRDGKNWAEQHGEVVTVYKIPGHSRKYIHFRDAAHDMPEYARLEQDCQRHAFDVLWCRERSRLGRTDALISTVEAVVLDSGAEVYSAAMPHQIGEATETSVIFTSAVERAMAQSENVQKERWHANGMRARVRRGLAPAKWPCGYRPIRDRLGKVVGGEFADEIEGVRLATEMFLNGDGYRTISLALNNTPWKPRSLGRWKPSSVRYMMVSDFYAGYPSCAEVKCSEKSDKYPALWDDETYHAVVRERKRRCRGGSRTGSVVSGCVYCIDCRRAMVTLKYRDVRYFRCATHAESSILGDGCHANNTQEHKIISVIEDALDKMRAMTPEDLGDLLRSDEDQQERERLKNRVKQITARPSPLSTPYDQCPDLALIGKAHLPLDQIALSVKDEERGHASHVMTLCNLLPQFAEYAQPHHSRLSLQFAL